MEKNTVSVKLADELEDISRLFRCNFSNIAAIDEAIMYGTRGAEDYADGISLLVNNMFDLGKRLTVVCDMVETKHGFDERMKIAKDELKALKPSLT